MAEESRRKGNSNLSLVESAGALRKGIGVASYQALGHVLSLPTTYFFQFDELHRVWQRLCVVICSS